MTREQEKRLLTCIDVLSRVVRNLCTDDRWANEFNMVSLMIEELNKLREEG